MLSTIVDIVDNEQRLHAFCDASDKAYGACVYLRVLDVTGIIYFVQNHASFSSKRLVCHASSYVGPCYYQNWWERCEHLLASGSKARRTDSIITFTCG